MSPEMEKPILSVTLVQAHIRANIGSCQILELVSLHSTKVQSPTWPAGADMPELRPNGLTSTVTARPTWPVTMLKVGIGSLSAKETVNSTLFSSPDLQAGAN